MAWWKKIRSDHRPRGSRLCRRSAGAACCLQTELRPFRHIRMNKHWRFAVPIALLENAPYDPGCGFSYVRRFLRHAIEQVFFDSRVQSVHFCHRRSVLDLSDNRKRIFFGSIVRQAMYSSLHMSDKIDVRFPEPELPVKEAVEAEAKRRNVSVGRIVRETLAEKFGRPAESPVNNFFKPQ